MFLKNLQVKKIINKKYKAKYKKIKNCYIQSKNENKEF